MDIILTAIELLNSMSDVIDQANDFLENLTFLELLLAKNNENQDSKDKKKKN